MRRPGPIKVHILSEGQRLVRQQFRHEAKETSSWRARSMEIILESSNRAGCCSGRGHRRRGYNALVQRGKEKRNVKKEKRKKQTERNENKVLIPQAIS